MSRYQSCLFNLFMDGLVKKVNIRVVERKVCLQSIMSRGVREVRQLLFANNMPDDRN